MSEDIYFITGANGFIGSAMAYRLHCQGKKMSLLLHHSANHPLLKDIRATKMWGDLLNPDSYTDHLNEQVSVIHCAAFISFHPGDKAAVWRINHEGTTKLLQACFKANVKKMVFISAAAVWGSTSSPHEIITENSPLARTASSPYALSKIAAEDSCRDASREGLEIKIVNPVTVYGPGDISLHSGGRVVKEVCRKRIRVVPPGGTSWIAIDDLVKGILLVAEKGERGENYILSSGNCTFKGLFSLISSHYGRTGANINIPACFNKFASWSTSLKSPFAGRNISSEQIKEAFRYKYFNSQKAERELGFKPEVGLERSVRETIEFNQQFRF